MLLAERLLIIALPLLSLMANGQSSGVREPTRPMVDHVTTVQPGRVDGVTYEIPIYAAANNDIRRGNGAEEEEEYFYYPPPIQLIAATEDELKADYVLRDGAVCGRTAEDCIGNRDLVEGLLLYAQKVPNTHDQIVKEVKRVLPKDEGRKRHIHSLAGRFWFASNLHIYPRVDSSKGRILSNEIRIGSGLWLETKQIPVYFPIKNKHQGDVFLSNLEHEYDRVVFNYRFQGVSVHQCEAHYESRTKSQIVIDEDRVSPQQKTKDKRVIVGMDRLFSIAKSVAKETTLIDRCNDDKRRALLHTRIEHDIVQAGEVLNWNEAEKLLTDEDKKSYLADVTRHVKGAIRKREEEQNVVDQSDLTSGGVKVGVGRVGVGAGASVQGEGRSRNDTIKVEDVTYSLVGEYYQPKQVFVAKEDSVNTFLSGEHIYDLGTVSPADGQGTLTLGKEEGWALPSTPFDEVSLASSVPQIKVCWFRWDRSGSEERYFNLGRSEWSIAWGMAGINDRISVHRRANDDDDWELYFGHQSGAVSRIRSATVFFAKNVGTHDSIFWTKPVANRSYLDKPDRVVCGDDVSEGQSGDLR